MKRKTGNTILKVVIVLLITLSVLGAISYYSYTSYTSFSQAVDKLYNPNEEPSFTESILTDISELESRSRAYSITLNENDLALYLGKVDHLKDQIDSLYLRSFGTNYHQEADTLRRLFGQKTESFEGLIKLKISQSQREEDKSALRALARTQREIKADSVLIPRQQITTTTITRTDEREAEEVKQDDGFFKRIFSKKEKDDSPPVKKEIKEERTVAYDTAYFEKVDTLITSVKEALWQAENQRRRQSRLLTRQELDRVANDQRIIDQLRSITLKIKQLENHEARAEKKETVATARESFSSVVTWAICGGLLAIILVYFVISDILRGRELQIQLAKAKSEAERLALVKEEFLANMSHEIRTPLNAIIGFSEQIASSQLEDDQRQKLNNVRSSSDHLLMLVNDILDYSKIESGKLRLEEIGFRASTVVNESLATLEHLAVNKGIELRKEIDPDLEHLILKGDPIRLKQVLINLAGNGVKFTEAGYVKITAKLISKEDGAIKVCFKVEDTGKGIAPSKLHKIFEGFNQEDSSINRRYGGTGLGLTISKKLVQLQGGKIEVESEEGEGSGFSVYIDYSLAEQENYSGKFDAERVEINLKGHSLLMIDDDNMNHVLLKPSFERWGLEFESAYDGADGVKKATQNNFEFILVDLQMPGKNGFEVIKAIRQPDSASAHSRIILCTANALIRNAKEELLIGVDATLLKPFKEYEVAALLAGLTPEKYGPNPQLVPVSDLYSLDNFNAYAGYDKSVLREFLISFIETNKEHLRLLDEYFEKKDYENVGDTAHKMRNTFGQLKAREVLQQLVELEKLISDSQPRKVINERLTKTHTHAEELFALLQDELRHLEPQDQTLSP